MSSEISEAVATPDSSTFSPPHEHDEGQAPEDTNELDYNREVLMKKLQDMPMETLKAIITNQLDLEIRLKHKELSLTEKEVGKCESQMITLRKFFKIPSNVNFDNEPNGFTHKYSNLLSQALNVNYENISKLSSLADLLGPGAILGGAVGDGNRISYSASSSVSSMGGAGQGDGFGSGEFTSGGSLGGDDGDLPTHSYRTRSTTSSLRPSSSMSSRRQTYGCLYRRTDGIIVKLTCPTCLRSNFSSAQGFLNHSRIAHSKEYTSQDAAALQCGEILPNEEQDEEGILSLQNLKLKGLDPKNHLNVNEIYFNGLSTSMNYERNDGQPSGQSKAQNQNQSQNHNQNQHQHHQQASQKPLDIPRRKSNDQLMKKLIAKGITSDKKEYDKLVLDTMSEVKNSHLFNGEEDEVDEGDNEDSSNTNNNSNSVNNSNNAEDESRRDKIRRKSRGGVGISKPGSYSSKNNKNAGASSSIHSGLPKLKLKIKRSSEGV
ncbi:hypothetical protein CLIB1423_25S00166 [[Candida] railenensis]|uniref:AHC1-like C2H2 zinc-finger domain-containing protein n=1 Tax=[Candida] railenensis TaxID=45579 RepID=A0A9P0QUP1_9ASCO|nr:hypothetical protein CLIB1423_25S00166 [[Candida] railenensis]